MLCNVTFMKVHPLLSLFSLQNNHPSRNFFQDIRAGYKLESTFKICKDTNTGIYIIFKQVAQINARR
jgi:hypothetical protein